MNVAAGLFRASGNMKYIIMCGGSYKAWEKPRQLTEINGEPIVKRTIRLLRACGVQDIAISSNNDVFKQFGVPVLKHENDYHAYRRNVVGGHWANGFYPTDEPTCYLFGDVVFSPDAVRTIVEYETDDIMFFGSKRPFAKEYPKRWVEPFAFKVVDVERFREAIQKVKHYDAAGRFKRTPIAWELWFTICGHPFEDLENEINNSYVGINDYTCDIDYPKDVSLFEDVMENGK